VSSVAAPRALPAPLAVDWRQESYFGAVAIAAALTLALISSIPPDPKSLSIDPLLRDHGHALINIRPPVEPPVLLPKEAKGARAQGGGGKPAPGESGRMGKPTAPSERKLFKLAGKTNDPHSAKLLSYEAARESGALGVIAALQGSHVASVFGRDSALGPDAENVMGGLVGTEYGESYGTGGRGLFGSRNGGGGTGDGDTIGIGDLPTIGRGGRGPSGGGYGVCSGCLADRKHKLAPVEIPPPVVVLKGTLDKEIIRRVVHQHKNEIKFCYERELAQKRDLDGRVTTQFTILGNGAVTSALTQATTLNYAPVEQCIAQAVRRWSFPKPEGGGIVIVSYPFVLHQAASQY
jgi:hypothetical protein